MVIKDSNISANESQQSDSFVEKNIELIKKELKKIIRSLNNSTTLSQKDSILSKMPKIITVTNESKMRL